MSEYGRQTCHETDATYACSALRITKSTRRPTSANGAAVTCRTCVESRQGRQHAAGRQRRRRGVVGLHLGGGVRRGTGRGSVRFRCARIVLRSLGRSRFTAGPSRAVVCLLEAAMPRVHASNTAKLVRTYRPGGVGSAPGRCSPARTCRQGTDRRHNAMRCVASRGRGRRMEPCLRGTGILHTRPGRAPGGPALTSTSVASMSRVLRASVAVRVDGRRPGGVPVQQDRTREGAECRICLQGSERCWPAAGAGRGRGEVT